MKVFWPENLMELQANSTGTSRYACVSITPEGTNTAVFGVISGINSVPVGGYVLSRIAGRELWLTNTD